SAAAKKKFDADPKHFLPQFGGLCTTALGGPYGNRLPGDPTVFDVRKGKVYLFSTERAKRAYVKNDPDWIIGQAEELSKKPVLRGRCPVSYFTAGRATPGKEKIKFLYRGSLYYFANKKARAAFIKDPQRYLPQYGGYSMDRCLDRRLNEPDPALFAVHEGKLYFFFSESGRARFLADPLAMIAEVDLHWAVITGKTD
ncbi:MAG: YHS domain-containing (seleno)protein, partial [Phycisphaerae bacterium]